MMLENSLKLDKVFVGDNLSILNSIDDGVIDLIYLDPPFNTGKVWKKGNAEFRDVWNVENSCKEVLYSANNKKIKDLISVCGNIGGDGYGFYLSFMSARLIQLYRVLKSAGSVYLHCDSKMSHNLKLLMDIIFGTNNFRNEIIWERVKGAGKRSQYGIRNFGRSSDTILFYSKSSNYIFNADAVSIPYDDIEKQFPHMDTKGSFEECGKCIFTLRF